MENETVSMMVDERVGAKAGEMANGNLNGMGDETADDGLLEATVEKMREGEAPTSFEVRFYRNAGGSGQENGDRDGYWHRCLGVL